MDEERSPAEDVPAEDPDVPVEDGSQETDLAGDTDEGSDAADVTPAEANEGSTDDAEAPPGAHPDEQVPDEVDAGDQATSESGTPDVPPPSRDDRSNPDGLPITTTTGDATKDFRGPTVTDEARDAMKDDPALSEPGYGDLGHAEDRDILRED